MLVVDVAIELSVIPVLFALCQAVDGLYTDPYTIEEQLSRTCDTPLLLVIHRDLFNLSIM